VTGHAEAGKLPVNRRPVSVSFFCFRVNYKTSGARDQAPVSTRGPPELPLLILDNRIIFQYNGAMDVKRFSCTGIIFIIILSSLFIHCGKRIDSTINIWLSDFKDPLNAHPGLYVETEKFYEKKQLSYDRYYLYKAIKYEREIIGKSIKIKLTSIYNARGEISMIFESRHARPPVLYPKGGNGSKERAFTNIDLGILPEGSYDISIIIGNKKNTGKLTVNETYCLLLMNNNTSVQVQSGLVLRFTRKRVSEKNVELLIELLKSDYFYLHKEIIVALGTLKQAKAVDPLINALSHADPAIRSRAAGALGKIGDKKASGPLIHALKDEHLSVRHVAVEALGKIRSERALDALIKILDVKTDLKYLSGFKNQVLASLDNYQSGKVIAVFKKLLYDTDNSVAYAAAAAMSKRQSQEAFNALIEYLDNGSNNAQVRETVAYYLILRGNTLVAADSIIGGLYNYHALRRKKVASALSKLNAADIARAIKSERAIGALFRAFSDKNEKLRSMSQRILSEFEPGRLEDVIIEGLNGEISALKSTIHFLGKMNEKSINVVTEKVEQSLIDAFLYRSLDGDSYYALLNVLKWTKSEKVQDILIHQVNHPEYVVRIRALSALQWNSKKPDHLIDPLVEAILKSKYDYFRKTAIETLGLFKSEKALDELIKLSNHGDRKIRREAVFALGNSGSDKGLEVLSRALKDKEVDVRQRAIRALIKIQPEKTIDFLIIALKDKRGKLRRIAIETLAKVNSEKGVERLIEALNSKDGLVRGRIIKILGKIRTVKALDALVKATNHIDSKVRSESVKVLGEIKAWQALDALIRALKDENVGVRREAARVLGNFKDQKAVDALSGALHDTDTLTRENASRSLKKIRPDEK
jgi:HEAT repeat protein